MQASMIGDRNDGGSHRGQTILLSACTTSTKAPTSSSPTISGTTTGTSLSLTVAVHTLPWTVEKLDVKLVLRFAGNAALCGNVL